jgi:hypothetical protein
MFEKFFNKEKGPEQQILEVIRQELEAIGVNQPGILRAYEAAQRENEDKQLGFGNMFILNLLEREAMGSSSSMDDVMYGGVDNTMSLITSEINRLKDQERSSWGNS